ncbi:MAG: low molecular weight protein-tyrosine-phosphatase [Pseudomonadota bacterium]
MPSVLFVCMGNICRSPMAEGIFRREIARAGLQDEVRIDSAGTHDYHIGAPPDARAQNAISRRGVDISGLRGRQVGHEDFEKFDYILAMDKANLGILKRNAPAHAQDKIRLLLSYSRKYPNQEVPDPYYGGIRGFDENLDMIEDAVEGLIDEIRAVVIGRAD